MIVDLFAGPGGWDLGARVAGLDDPVGIEVDRDARTSRHFNGLDTLWASVAEIDPLRFAGVDGLIASPPCPDFSVATQAAGSRGVGREGRSGWLVDEPLRWITALRPRWVACEQVPPVLPIWEEHAEALAGLGYRTWTGCLSAEEYGVPQTRRRAFLLARLDATPTPPPPTHQPYVYGRPAGRDGDLAPWVSMADALGWTRDGWWQTRPATTLAGDPRCFAPGGHIAHDGRDNSKMVGRSADAVRLTAEEASKIQAFPDSYRWTGSSSAVFRQIGNAVPPPVAAAVLSNLVA